MPVFACETLLPAPPHAVFDWHARPGALARLTPPWEPLEVLSHTGESIMDGSRFVLRVGRRPFRFHWVALHENYLCDEQFGDRQVSGPFAEWRHLRRFEAEGEEGCRLREEITYSLPGGRVSEAFLGAALRRRLERAFHYRHETLRQDLARHRAFPDAPRLRIALTGGSGLIGTRLRHFLSTGGHEVRRLVRRPTRAVDEISWNPAAGELDAAALEGLDAVVHLAGENIAGGRWSPARKFAIRDSRVQGTRLLAETLARMAHPPRVLVSTSAIGFYGDRGEEWVEEGSPPGQGFLSEVGQAWEAATESAAAAGIRVVLLRVGLVLAAEGGALARMLPAFRLGLGGRLGGGRQMLSWIDADDLLGAFHFALLDETLSGPVNATAPAPVANAEFTRALAGALGRWVGPPLPAFVLRLLLGEMGQALLLSGARVRPARLLAAGFRFFQPDLAASLRRQLGLGPAP